MEAMRPSFNLIIVFLLAQGYGLSYGRKSAGSGRSLPDMSDKTSYIAFGMETLERCEIKQQRQKNKERVYTN